MTLTIHVNIRPITKILKITMRAYNYSKMFLLLRMNLNKKLENIASIHAKLIACLDG